MITRFKLEADGQTREEVVAKLVEAAEEIFQLEGTNIHWECTQDVVAGKAGKYAGRVIWKRRNGSD